MKANDVHKRIKDLFSKHLQARGFAAATDAEFICDDGNVVRCIGFPYSTTHTTSGKCNLMVHVMVANRFLNLERLFPSEEASQFVPAVASPIHLLRPDKVFVEWNLDDPRSVPAVLAQVDELGIPFLNKYSDLGEVRRRLASAHSSDWFTLDSERRIALLASIALIDNDRTEALRLVDLALEERRNARSEKRWMLEQLQKTIQSRSC